MIERVRAWLKERRRRRLEREARELAELLQQARTYRRYSRFIGSVLDFNRRRGYVTPKQHAALRLAVRRAIATYHGA